MPSSSLVLVPTIVTMIAECQPVRVLDVGPGNGKYGVLVREYVPSVKQLDAVEAEPRYLERFPWLSGIYDSVGIRDVTVAPNAYLARYDLVLLLDVLEHIDKDAGVELLRRIPGTVIVNTPMEFFQNPEHIEYPSEMHRSLWSAAEIATIRPIDREDVWAAKIGGVLVRCPPL